MSWFKVDDKLWGSPKWLALKSGARALWVTAGAWSMDQLTDGHIPSHVLPILGGRPTDARALVAARLWSETENGFRFHDWHEYQPARDEVVSKREADAARKAEWRSRQAEKRKRERERQQQAEKAELSQGDASRTSGVTDAGVTNMSRSSRPDPTRPDPPSPNGEGKKRGAKAPADEVATTIYEATSKMVKYIAVRNVATKALDTGASVERITAVMLDLYRRKRPLTLETVGQELQDNLRHLPSNNRSRKRYMSDFTEEEFNALPVAERAAVWERSNTP